MITKWNLFEDADEISTGEYGDAGVISPYYKHPDAYPFMVDKYDKIYISDIPGISHGVFRNNYFNKHNLNLQSDAEFSNCIGRIWVKRKIIAFWENQLDINDVLKGLESQMKEHGLMKKEDSIFNSGWRIEKDEEELVPVEDYYGVVSLNKDAYKLHLMKAPEKTKRLKEMGYKPKVKKWKEWQKPFEMKHK